MISPTSREAYHKVNLSHNEQIVFDVIADQGIATNDSIASQLGWEINRVTGRTNGLFSKGLIAVLDNNGTTKMGNKAKRFCIKDPNDKKLMEVANEATYVGLEM